MKVAIIGGTGFVGSYITDALLEAGHEPRLLVRAGSESKVPSACETVPGDVGNLTALSECLDGCDAAIYLIGILREDPARGITFDELQHHAVLRTIDAAKEQGVHRFLLMSANGVRIDGTPYQRTKAQAEDGLMASGLDWTILRPSVIFGPPRGRMELATQLKRDIIDSPLPAPLFYPGLLPRGAGAFELAPTHVGDVAAAFVTALDDPGTIRRSYDLCGPKALSWKELLKTIAQVGNRHKLMLPSPAIAVATIAGLLERFSWFPLTRDQLSMLLAGNVCSGADGYTDLGIQAKPFTTEHLRYLMADESEPTQAG